jgi:hypothetical protein
MPTCERMLALVWADRACVQLGIHVLDTPDMCELTCSIALTCVFVYSQVHCCMHEMNCCPATHTFVV